MAFKFIFLALSSFLAATNGLTIDCSYASLGWGYGLVSVYTCQGTVNALDNNEAITAVTDSTGSATSGLTNSDVKVFYLMNGYNSRFETIPSNFATTFPNLQGIYWMGSKLRTISPSDLAGLPNLVIISVSNNIIRKIDGNLFQNNHLLQFIDLSTNAIQEVGPGLLNGLNALTFFQIYGNICSGSSQLYVNPPDNTLADVQRDLDFVCGPLSGSSGTTPPPCGDACLANCTARAAALQIRVNVLTESVNAPWYYKLRMFLKAVLLW